MAVVPRADETILGAAPGSPFPGNFLGSQMPPRGLSEDPVDPTAPPVALFPERFPIFTPLDPPCHLLRTGRRTQRAKARKGQNPKSSRRSLLVNSLSLSLGQGLSMIQTRVTQEAQFPLSSLIFPC